MSLKLITFDLDNTLWFTDPVIIKAEKVQWQWIEKLSPKANEHFTPDSLQRLKLEIGQQQPELRHKLSQLRLEFLYQIFLTCGHSSQQAQVLAQQTFSQFLQARNQVTLFPGALDLLQSLQQDYQVIALSNGNSDLKMIGIDHLFNAHFHAENVPKPKPHADMFLAALEYAGIEASESLHIGDHPEQDVNAAQKLGFKTTWVNILGSVWPENLMPADHEITHLDQLTQLINQIR